MIATIIMVISFLLMIFFYVQSLNTVKNGDEISKIKNDKRTSHIVTD